MNSQTHAQLRRLIGRMRFAMVKLPHQVMHHTLRHDAIRKPLVNIVKRFPFIHRMLRSIFVHSEQRIAKERIWFQRYTHPNLVVTKNRKASPVSPEDLANITKKPYGLEQILKNIEHELWNG